MKHSKILFAFLLLWLSTYVNAQVVLYKSVIASGGNSYTSAGLSADWTIGQTVANQYTGTGLTITEGFHPVYIALPAPSNVTAVNSNIKSVQAYPNPTNNILHIAIVQNEPKAISIQVLDIIGKVVLNVITLPAQLSVNTDVDMYSLSPGIYIIVMNANTPDAYVIKVLKQ